MTSDAAVAVATSQPMGPLARAAAFVSAARSAAADGLTWREFGDLLVALMRLMVASLDDLATMSGAEKKAVVLEAVEALFDAVADKCVPLVLWPVWLIARPAVRSLIVALAAGAVEQLLPLVRSAK